ncbi:nuclear transport factor 2 family protein [Frigidibacter albus]|uniref:Nuclear transport factor 2 family protein n=1 Tax=Frigidibacter albus TaxID=1465486 RepID=A0A6L8VH26_9RHOB|nr:nuclear transport factor 2 family protein [Frigidibacter albus]MZQ88629.1 nuclear transport factor 2 family protein [Frigidibacter albus]NBE30562.1 nuclear transport factor 2 family protein [Frigidibacter albus]GGH49527.1 hypothetical protein GCM10011341_11890 [Frigidibacter albus]
MTDKFNSFSSLLRAALGARLAPAEDMMGMFAADIVFEFPFAPEGMPARLEGRAALAGHLAKLGPLIDFGEMTLGAVHPAGETVVIEFTCTGRGTQTGTPYDQTYISVVTMRDGRIACYRDYWNPLVVLSALGGAEAAAAAYAGRA